MRVKKQQNPHGKIDWFKIEKEVGQGYLFSLFTLYSAHPEKLKARIKIDGRNIKNLRHVDATMLMAESEEELKNLLMMVKEEREREGLKLYIYIYI